MTDTEILIEVAKLDGWTFDDRFACKNGEEWHINNWKNYNHPKYLTSRDAIIPVIEKQHQGGQIAVIHHLHGEVSIKHESDWRTEDIIAMLMASPRQLSTALLKSCKKWRD